MDKLKQLSRLWRVSSSHAKYSGRTPTLTWHTGVHPLMLTFVYQLRCSTREYLELLCLKGPGTRTPKLQLTEITSTTIPPRVLHTMITTASQRSCYMLNKLSLYSMMPRPSGSQPQWSVPSKTSWFILGSSHWGRPVQTCTWSYPWMSFKCCQARYTVSTDVAPAIPESSPGLFPETSTSSPSNTKTSNSCTCSYHTHGHSKETTNCSCSVESIHWKCHKGDQCSTHCHSPINQSQEAPNLASWGDVTWTTPGWWTFCAFSKLITSPTFCSQC